MRNNKKLTVIPRLKVGDDEAVAKQLGRYAQDASDGARRILIAGLFINQIAQNLPHGQLGPWVKAHQDEIGAQYSTILAWRQLANNVLEVCGIKTLTVSEFSIPLHEALVLPLEKLPEDLHDMRKNIDDLVTGKSYRQLYWSFKNSEEFNDEVFPVTGRGRYHKTRKDGTPRKKKRSKAEIEHERFKLQAIAATGMLRTAFVKLSFVLGPKQERAWDVLSDEELHELKLSAADLANGCAESQGRRARLKQLRR